MKKTIAALAFATAMSHGQTVLAAESGTANVPKQVIVSTSNEAASSAANWVLPLMILVMVAASIAGD